MLYKNANKIVIKIGSSLISPTGVGCSARYTLPIARFIHQCQRDGKQIILVSSGSVAAGRQHIKLGDGNPSLAQKQAMAAVGQNAMMDNWKRYFDNPCAQILVTHNELKNPESRANICNTLNELLVNDLLPIINENDSVAIEELKVGDNDRLAAMVATLVNADLFLICSDVDGLFEEDPSKNPKAKRIDFVSEVNESIYSMAGGSASQVGTGGMKTKLDAAAIAMESGVDTLLFSAKIFGNFERIRNNEALGTQFSNKG